uniref:Uncharacterized protein n=1 Tax=Rhizophora mucronata TaxID=61149 RepID=A0A2P2PE27_RHIMU
MTILLILFQLHKKLVKMMNHIHIQSSFRC